MQYLVNVKARKEREEIFSWFVEHGYEGLGHLIDGAYPYSTVVIDGNRVFGGNVTCFAAAASCGARVLSWREWLEERRKNTYYDFL